MEMPFWSRKMLDKIKVYNWESAQDKPSWLGDPAFHRAHQSNLLRKDPEWYGQFGWEVKNDLPYVWPV